MRRGGCSNRCLGVVPVLIRIRPFRASDTGDPRTELLPMCTGRAGVYLQVLDGREKAR